MWYRWEAMHVRNTVLKFGLHSEQSNGTKLAILLARWDTPFNIIWKEILKEKKGKSPLRLAFAVHVQILNHGCAEETDHMKLTCFNLINLHKNNYYTMDSLQTFQLSCLSGSNSHLQFTV